MKVRVKYRIMIEQFNKRQIGMNYLVLSYSIGLRRREIIYKKHRDFKGE